MTTVIPVKIIEKKIPLIRGEKVMLDADLAELYGVETKRLNEQVGRNPRRFPADFMFQLTPEEYESLRSHFATLRPGRGRHRKYLPYVFTEQVVAMLSSVLNSDRAIEVNVQIMRVFVKLREMISANKDLARRLDDLEKKYDTQFRVILGDCPRFTDDAKRRRRIGTVPGEMMAPPDRKGKEEDRFQKRTGDVKVMAG